METGIGALAARYPFLRAGGYGRSAMGRPLEYAAFGVGKGAGIFTAAHHANEWITCAALMAALEGLCARCAAGDAAVRELYAKARLVFVPLVNPDGAALARGELGGGPYYARASGIASGFPGLPFPEGWKANIEGVDLNLQYPAGWKRARDIKFAQGWDRAAPRDYVGRAPLCAPEARALALLTLRLRPRAALALHSQGGAIYWQYGGSAPPGAEELAARLSAASGYALDSPPPESANAGYKDWIIAKMGVPAFTAECGLGENPLPLTQLGAITGAVAGMCRALAEYCAAA